MRQITKQILSAYGNYLTAEEKSRGTIGKYTHDVSAFAAWLDDRDLTREEVLAYKAYLLSVYAPKSVNGALSSLNSFFTYAEWDDLKVKMLKIQRQTYLDSNRELTREEYIRLLNAAKKAGKIQLYWLMQTVCSTGIRISELRFVTVEAVGTGYADVANKGNRRRVWLSAEPRQSLKKYTVQRKIKKIPSL